MATKVVMARRAVIGSPSGLEAGAMPSTESESGPLSVQDNVVASFENYQGAQRAVDYLSDRKFPVEKLSIVAEGLRLVERITGRLTWWNALLRGLASGAVVGLIVGLLLGLLVVDPAIWLNLLGWGLLFGAVVGAIFGVVGHAATGGRRDFSSYGGIAAERYDVIAAPDVADEARRILDEMPPLTAAHSRAG
jgi:hypothetical protein